MSSQFSYWLQMRNTKRSYHDTFISGSLCKFGQHVKIRNWMISQYLSNTSRGFQRVPGYQLALKSKLRSNTTGSLIDEPILSLTKRIKTKFYDDRTFSSCMHAHITNDQTFLNVHCKRHGVLIAVLKYNSVNCHSLWAQANEANFQMRAHNR